MHPSVRIVDEDVRGCGRRKVGGLYLVSDGPAEACGKMPIPLEVCPCCGQGFKPSRAPQWIEHPERLWRDMICNAGQSFCSTCPLSASYETGPALLIWVGSKYYKNIQDFVKESEVMGISRRIKSIPRGFVVGETWVMLAHRKAIELGGVFNPETQWQPGIFRMFRPTRIEIIITGDESDKIIEGYLKRGLTPVYIRKREKQADNSNQSALL